MAKTPATDDLTEQAERLRATGQDPVRWLATLAEREEKLLEWKRRKRITSLGPDEVARAIRETHIWCAPSVILAIGELRTDIARRRTAEDLYPSASRRAVKFRADERERALRRIGDAIADPGSDVPASEAEQIRLDSLAFEIRRFVGRRRAEGATKREAMTEAARMYHFGSRVKAGPIVRGKPTDGSSSPGWEAVERFLIRRRPKKSTDVSTRSPGVSPRFLDEKRASLDNGMSPKEGQKCRDRETRNDPAEPNSPSTSRPSSSAARPSRGRSTSPKGRSATSNSAGSGRSPSAPKGPGSSSTTSTNGSRTSGAAPRRRPTGRSRSSGS